MFPRRGWVATTMVLLALVLVAAVTHEETIPDLPHDHIMPNTRAALERGATALEMASEVTVV